MKPPLSAFFIPLLLSCSAPNSEMKNDSTSDTAKVKSEVGTNDKINTLIEKDTIKHVQLSGQIFWNNSYCNGAAPSEELLEEHRKLRWLTNSNVILKNTKTKEEVVLSAGEKGFYSTDVPVGKYKLYLSKNINKQLGTGFNSTCNVWLTQVMDEFMVKEGIDSMRRNFTITFDCDPCDLSIRQRP